MHTHGFIYALARLAIPYRRWIYRGRGRCPSCGRRTMFVLASRHAQWVRALAGPWDNSERFKRELAERESNICVLCGATIRMRAQAAAVLDVLGCATTADLAGRMRREPQLRIYEAAYRNVFRAPDVVGVPNYVASEYQESAMPGELVRGIRNENIEALSFADDSFDIVLTSEVLEHVAHLDAALAEILRVLKPGGFHVCTVPHDDGLATTRERAVIAQGRVEHLLPPVLHGDSIRAEGILAFRDFGADAAEVLARGAEARKPFEIGDARGFAATVFVTRKPGPASGNAERARGATLAS